MSGDFGGPGAGSENPVQVKSRRAGGEAG